MNIQRSMARGIAVLGAASAAAVVAPTVSSAAPAQESQQTTTVTKQAAAKGTNAVSCGKSGGVIRGCAGFQAKGELLIACDRRADGRSVVAQLYWAGKVRAAVKDINGAKKPCYYKNLSIREGTPVWVRVYVQGLGYTRWVRGTA